MISKNKRNIGVVTVARSDYGIYRPILNKISSDKSLRLHLIVAGTHLLPQFGFTVSEIEEDGFSIGDRVSTTFISDSPDAIASLMGESVSKFGESYHRTRPDILLVLGDRYEMHAAALAALPFKIPVAHIHGGELTEGAFDDALRHSMTKLSHLHFVSTEEYAKRVAQLGEEPWRVTVSGAPGLDNLKSIRLSGRKKLEKKYGWKLKQNPILVTFHPVTLEYEDTDWQIRELLAALSKVKRPLVFTMPNADTHHRVVAEKIQRFVSNRKSAYFMGNLGTHDYFSFMSIAAAMVGNSSSGIIEAPSLKLPAVNIGNRQKGRIRARNVIDVGYRRSEILNGLQQAMRPEFKKSLENLVNPYGWGDASQKIVEVLKTTSLSGKLIRKKFYDIPVPVFVTRKVRPACVMFGSGGHARVLMDCLRESGQADVRIILDADRSLWRKKVSGALIIGGDRFIKKVAGRGVTHFVVGMGAARSNALRQRLFRLGLSAKLVPLTVKHPTAICSTRAWIGAGSQLLPRSVVNAGAILGRNVIVNTGAIVEHDCRILDHVHVATGAKLAGAVKVGEGAFIGAGATVRQGIRIGKKAVVGAGAVVVKNVPANAVVAGVPAHILSERKK